MSKKYTRDQLVKEANQLFETRSEDKLFANPKGEFFTSENLAKQSLEKDEKHFSFERSAKSTETTPNVKETVALIAQVETIEELEVYASDERKDVVKAYAKRKSELTEPTQ